MGRGNRIQVRFSDEENKFIEGIARETNMQNKSDIVRTLVTMARLMISEKDLLIKFVNNGYLKTVKEKIDEEKEKYQQTKSEEIKEKRKQTRQKK